VVIALHQWISLGRLVLRETAGAQSQLLMTRD
jgi:hypothetical protein